MGRCPGKRTIIILKYLVNVPKHFFWARVSFSSEIWRHICLLDTSSCKAVLRQFCISLFNLLEIIHGSDRPRQSHVFTVKINRLLFVIIFTFCANAAVLGARQSQHSCRQSGGLYTNVWTWNTTWTFKGLDTMLHNFFLAIYALIHALR